MTDLEECPHGSHVSYCLDCFAEPRELAPSSTTKAAKKASSRSSAPNPASGKSALVFVWNPSMWEWTDVAEAETATQKGEVYKMRWSAGGRRNFTIGERAFLYRVAQDRGIIASGVVKSEAVRDVHWDGSKKAELFVEIEFDAINQNELPVEVLKTEVDAVSWDHFQSSGNRIADATKVVELWDAHRAAAEA